MRRVESRGDGRKRIVPERAFVRVGERTTAGLGDSFRVLCW